MSSNAAARAELRFPRITRRTIHVDLTYSRLLEAMTRSVTDFSCCEKKQVMQDASVLSLVPQAIAWSLLRDEVERTLGVKLIPISQYYFDKRARRQRRLADQLDKPDPEDVRRCLGYNRNPSGFLSATSPNPTDRAIVQEALKRQDNTVVGIVKSTATTRQIAAASVVRLANERQGRLLP